MYVNIIRVIETEKPATEACSSYSLLYLLFLRID